MVEADGSKGVEERAKRFMSEVVLCHNDLLSGNVLYADGWDRVQVSAGWIVRKARACRGLGEQRGWTSATCGTVLAQSVYSMRARVCARCPCECMLRYFCSSGDARKVCVFSGLYSTG